MTELVFVDTNVFVYRFDAGKPEKQKAAGVRVTNPFLNAPEKVLG